MSTDAIAFGSQPDKLTLEQYLAKHETPDLKAVATIVTSREQLEALNERREKMAVNSVSNNYGQIASGKAVNSAADDASGLAIANKLEKEDRALTQGAENAKETDDALKIADGAMEEMTEYLQRIRELSVQAQNQTASDSDKEMIQTEINNLLEGIQDVAKNTKYNEQNLLDGSMADMGVASNPDGRGMSIKMANGTLEALGIDGYDVTKDFDISRIDAALEKVSENRSTLGAGSNALEYAYNSNLNTAENVLASRSRIEDLDVAEAVSEQKKNEVINDYKIMVQRKEQEEEALVTKLFQ